MSVTGEAIIGQQLGGGPLNERENFMACRACGQPFDMRDLDQVAHHEGAGHGPFARPDRLPEATAQLQKLIMTDMTSPPLDYTKLREIAEKATPAVWFSDFYDEVCAILDGGRGAAVIIAQTNTMAELSPEASEANAKHIAAFSPSVCLALLADNARMVKRERELVKALEPFANLGVTSGPDDEPCSIPYRITRGSIRSARQALSGANHAD